MPLRGIVISLCRIMSQPTYLGIGWREPPPVCPKKRGSAGMWFCHTVLLSSHLNIDYPMLLPITTQIFHHCQICALWKRLERWAWTNSVEAERGASRELSMACLCWAGTSWHWCKELLFSCSFQVSASYPLQKFRQHGECMLGGGIMAAGCILHLSEFIILWQSPQWWRTFSEWSRTLEKQGSWFGSLGLLLFHGSDWTRLTEASASSCGSEETGKLARDALHPISACHPLQPTIYLVALINAPVFCE